MEKLALLRWLHLRTASPPISQHFVLLIDFTGHTHCSRKFCLIVCLLAAAQISPLPLRADVDLDVDDRQFLPGLSRRSVLQRLG